MKRFYRHTVLVIAIAAASLPFAGYAQTSSHNFSNDELAFLRQRLELKKPAAERLAGYQISGNPDHDQKAGRAYIHKQFDEKTVSLAVLSPKELTPMAYFGFSAQIKGDLAVVGAPGDGILATGSVYVFRRMGNAWAKVARLTSTDSQTRDDFGFSVHIAGKYIYIGAPGADVKYKDSGAVYIFEETAANTWTQVEKLVPDNEKMITSFGMYIEDAGATFIVGAETINVGDLDRNFAFAYSHRDGFWSTEQALLSSEQIYRHIAGNPQISKAR